MVSQDHQHQIPLDPQKVAHPREAADHHVELSTTLFARILADNHLKPSDIGAIAYSQGPGMGACLRTGAAAARTISTHLDVPLIGVNHCVAHIEIGKRTMWLQRSYFALCQRRKYTSYR